MQERGFLDQDEHRFMMLRDRLWRALRVIIDVSMHTRGMSIEEAAKLIERARHSTLSTFGEMSKSIVDISIPHVARRGHI